MTLVARKHYVDWFRVLAELRRVGLSQCEVARRLSLPRNRVKHWANGKAPRYEDGRALLLLWRLSCYRKLSPKGQRHSGHLEHGGETQPETPGHDQGEDTSESACKRLTESRT